MMGQRTELLKLQKNWQKRRMYKVCVIFQKFGKEAAMYAGLSYASGEYVTIMDADLQDPPSLLPE